MTLVASYHPSHHRLSRQIDSSDNPRGLGPLLNVITWILLITSSLAVGTRLITKRALQRRIDVDDVFVIAALVGRTKVQSVCFLWSVDNFVRSAQVLAPVLLSAFKLRMVLVATFQN